MEQKTKSTIKQILKFDSLAEAEKITGKSYKEDDSTGWLGLGLLMKNQEEKKTLMRSLDDTCFSETMENYMRIVKRIGFEVVYEENFVNKSETESVNEKFYVLWNNQYSILLVCDTFNGNRNRADMYYNWSPTNIETRGSYTESGCWVDFYFTPDLSALKPFEEPEPKWTDNYEEYKILDKAWQQRRKAYIAENNLRAVWCGKHDAREAIAYNVGQLAANGQFINKWFKQPHLWLLHWAKESNDPSRFFDNYYGNCTFETYQNLPDYVKEAIGEYKVKTKSTTPPQVDGV